MSGIGEELRDVGLGLASRVRYLAASVRRTSAGVALVRFVLFVAALAGFGLALPLGFTTSTLFLMPVALAAVVALFPRTRMVGIVLLLTVGAWLINTLAYETDPAPVWRIAALAAALYTAHTSAALAAVVPHDTIVAPGALLRWCARTLAVLAASLGLGAVGLAVVAQLRAVQSMVGPIVGSLVAAGLAGLIAWLLHRRTPQ